MISTRRIVYTDTPTPVAATPRQQHRSEETDRIVRAIQNLPENSRRLIVDYHARGESALNLAAVRHITERDVLHTLCIIYEELGLSRIPNGHQKGLVRDALTFIASSTNSRTVASATPSLPPAPQQPVETGGTRPSSLADSQRARAVPSSVPVSAEARISTIARLLTRFTESRRTFAREIARGFDNDSIAEHLYVGKATVSVKKSELFRELNIQDVPVNERAAYLKRAFEIAEPKVTHASVSLIETRHEREAIPKTEAPIQKDVQHLDTQTSLSETEIREIAKRIPLLSPRQKEILPALMNGVRGEELRKMLGYRDVNSAEAFASGVRSRLKMPRHLPHEERTALLRKVFVLYESEILPAQKKDTGASARSSDPPSPVVVAQPITPKQTPAPERPQAPVQQTPEPEVQEPARSEVVADITTAITHPEEVMNITSVSSDAPDFQEKRVQLTNAGYRPELVQTIVFPHLGKTEIRIVFIKRR